MTNESDFDSQPPAPPSHYLRLPLSKPFFTYILLAAIVIIWILMSLAGGSTNTQVLIRFGANYGPLILQGEVWRLFTSMFLHIGLTHLAFNAYALYVFGLEMERLYGPDRFIVIYILSGLFGSLASFASRGPNVLSAGASGAIFGIIGMNLAYFFLHRESFGQFGRQRVMNTLFIIGLNLFFGFTVPGIDNLAHAGGLIAGFALGYGLAPRYQVVDQYTSAPRVVDTISLLNRWWAPVLGVLILASGVPLAVSFWSG
jgi:membrane associated rhomboid family serine protease